MSYTNELLEADAPEKQRLLNEENARVWEQILDETDQTPGTAFKEAVIKWCDGRLTMDAYDMLAATSALPDFSSREWHRGTQDWYIGKIVEKLRGSHRWDDARIREKVFELRNMSKPEVRRYLDKIGFLEEVRTKEQAEDFLRRHRLLKTQQQYFDAHGQQWPRLPAMVVPEGHVSARPLDAFFLYKILDVSGLRRYVSRYGEFQINERVAATQLSLRGEIQ